MPLGRLEVFEAAEDNWEEYIERLVQFFVANEIEEDVKKRAILLSNVGARTYGVLRSLLSPVRPDEVSYDHIVNVLREHFHPRPSVTVARFRFFSCSRSINEPVQDYIARLKQLSRDCQFGSFLEEMIRDRLVCGINSDLIQSRLLSEPELSLQKATEMAVALETASRNQQELAGGPRVGQPPTEPAVQRIHTSESRPPHGRGSRENSSKPKFSDSEANKCWRCLSSKHSESECFFKRKRCFRCSKYGHTSAAHRAGTVNSLGDVPHQSDEVTVEDGEPGPEDTVVGDLFTFSAGLSRGRPPILLDVTLNGKQVQMELDTGASVSVCSYGRFKELWPTGDRLLRPTDILLRTFSGEKLVVRGEVILDVGYQGSTYQLPLVILEGRGPLLFGRNWLHQIRLNWQSICTVSSKTDVEAVVDKFPELFQDDLGCARDAEVSIPVDESASPIFYKPRTVPLAYKAQVDAELERQLKAGLLVPVKWNSWAAPIVAVPKASEPTGTQRSAGGGSPAPVRGQPEATATQVPVRDEVGDLFGTSHRVRRDKANGGKDACELPTPAETVHLMEFVDSTPVTASCIRTFTARDPVLSVVLQYTRDGWPTSGLLNPELVQFRRREGGGPGGRRPFHPVAAWELHRSEWLQADGATD
ncbi:uncharacterized protein K02A2.6-like isoform X2 [Amphibalanus amphitrite]|uniref:uncharacterized protein K02A2.6-like isoform X2 n=1 Tax=Amphibalanus amphitrite TaxID=1232801 RepID=UPI001C9093EF|nr:uncharacterized protein K02A2.6-like isoform X2 [Amphibalanus amphitrite]